MSINTDSVSRFPWFRYDGEVTVPSRAVVVGAGLAGAAVAEALASSGIAVVVLDAQAEVAQGASGNLAGAVHPLLTVDWNVRSQWYEQGLAATRRRVLPWVEAGEALGDFSGLVDLAADEKSAERLRRACQALNLSAEFLREVNADEASDLLGGAVRCGGVFFPQGGWLSPRSVVARCLRHELIEVELNACVTEIKRCEQGWQVCAGDRSWQADCVVVAGGALSELNEGLAMPIRPVKGQVSHLTEAQQAWPLLRAVSHKGYSAPCGDGAAVTGASFEAPSLDGRLTVAAHRSNLALVESCVPNWALAHESELEGRVGFRPTTADHMPIIGPVADAEWMASAYFSQPSSHPLRRYEPQRYLPGLFVSNGHGARGLMSVFLAAELIRGWALGDTVELPSHLLEAVHPARFAIRQWRRGGG